MTDKTSEAFRTISEVSTKLSVPPHVIRFWETKFNKLRPLKRSGGRRYYRPDDLAILFRIRDLLYKDGFTIKGAQRFLNSKEAVEGSKSNQSLSIYVSQSDLITAQNFLRSARKRLDVVKSQFKT